MLVPYITQDPTTMVKVLDNNRECKETYKVIMKCWQGNEVSMFSEISWRLRYALELVTVRCCIIMIIDNIPVLK